MKTVLITGAGRGIGRALCLEALKRGYQVHGLVRKSGDAPPGVTEHVSDLRDRAAIKNILDSLADTIDIYIANAGVDAPFKPLEIESVERNVDVFEVNGTATAFSVYYLAHLWAQGAQKTRGVKAVSAAKAKQLAVVSSLAAGRGFPRSGAYIATKTAQLVMCESLSFDLAPYGVAVSAIMPGFIDTEMSRALKTRPFLISSEKSAKIIWDGLERKKFRIAFPKSTAFMSALNNLMPYCMFQKVVAFLTARKMM